MKPKKPTKVVMAKGMGTSRTELDQQLDPENTSVMLHTLQKVVVVVEWKLRLGLARGMLTARASITTA